MPKDRSTQKHRLDIDHQKSLAKQFFLKEYERICEEIREINKNTIEYTKLFVALATSVFIYSAGGFLYYDKLTVVDGGKYYFAYSLFGFLLTIMIIGITAFFFLQLANSKKIKTRYWHSIDILRAYIKKKFRDFHTSLPFPPELVPKPAWQTKVRPNITRAEVLGYIVLGLLLEVIWLIVLVYFITNMFQSWEHIDKGRLIKAIAIANCLAVVILIFTPWQILSHQKMLKEAQMISPTNIFPVYPSGVHSRTTHFLLLAIGVILYAFVVSKIFGFSDTEYRSLAQFKHALALIIGSDIFFSLVCLFYYRQKRISSDAIQQIRDKEHRDPLATWERLIKLTLK